MPQQDNFCVLWNSPQNFVKTRLRIVQIESKLHRRHRSNYRNFSGHFYDIEVLRFPGKLKKLAAKIVRELSELPE